MVDLDDKCEPVGLLLKSLNEMNANFLQRTQTVTTSVEEEEKKNQSVQWKHCLLS